MRITRHLRAGATVCFVVSLSAAMLLGQHGASPSDPAPRSSKNIPTLLQEGTRLAEQKRFAEAQVPLKKALADAPANFNVLLTLGKVDARLGELDQGIRLLCKAAAIEPEDAEVHFDLALALAGAGRLPEALKEISIAEKLKPKSEETHLHRGRMLAQLNHPAQAASEFAVAKSLDPRDPRVYFYWALLERDQGNLQKETQLLQALTRVGPYSSIAFYLLGKSLSSQGKIDEAILALKTAIKLNPNASEATYLLAMDMRKKDPEAAKVLMRRFQRLREQQAGLSHIEALALRAVHDAAKGDSEDAVELFHKALAECNGCSVEEVLRRNLGLTLCRSGRIVEGTTELKKALKLDPDDAETAKALRALEGRRESDGSRVQTTSAAELGELPPPQL